MAKKLDPRLLEILTTYGERPEDALWDCHGTWVAYHKAIERIAAKAGIVFDMPQVIEANSAAKTVTIAVRGTMGERVEWSFGEASPANNKNAYPFAMAEKRAKDRVVIKLVGLAGIYSEEEADDFKPAPGSVPMPESERQERARRSANSLKKDIGRVDQPDNWGAFLEELLECNTVERLKKLALAWSHIAERDGWPDGENSWREQAREEINKRREVILNGPREQSDFPGDPSYVPRVQSVLEAGE